MKFTLLISFILVSSLRLVAQTNNSPYSLLGIGDIDDSYYNRTTGMANTGIAYRSTRNLINNNPASFSGLDNQFFAGELGVRLKYVQYYGNPISSDQNRSTDITFRRFVVGTKITNHLGTSFGLLPYSSQNYAFNSPVPIQGTNGETANVYTEGNGGLYRVYMTNSYELFKHVSLGLSTSYLFGALTQKSILQDASLLTLTSTTHSTVLSKFYLDYGIQYYGSISRRWDFSLGATFANRQNLNAQYKLLILGRDSSTLENETLSEGTYALPSTVGIGVALTKDKKYSFLADYKYQGWSSLNYAGFDYQLVNSNRISAGFEISNKKNVYNYLIETSFFQAGLYYNESYLQVNGQQIKDMGATVGFGSTSNAARFPQFGYSFTLQYGIKGTQSNGLIQERYINLTFMLSFRDLWYTKGRKYD